MNHSSAKRYNSVIPPYMLNRIIEHGSEPQRRCARQTLVHVNTLMAQPYAKPQKIVTAKAGQVERDIYDAKNTTRLPGNPCVRKVSQVTAMCRWMKPMIILA